jgi:hypothetical protein
MIDTAKHRQLMNLTLLPLLAFLIVFSFWDLIIYRLDFIWNHIFRGGDILQHVAPTWRYYFAHKGIDVGGDIISDYYLDVILPPLYKFFYWFLTLFVTPPESSSIIALGINLIILSALTASAYVVTRSALVTVFVSGLTLNFMTLSSIWSTGLERSIGSALLSISLFFLVSGRFRYLGFLAVVSVLIYPPAALLIFGSYALALRMEEGLSLKTAQKLIILGVLFVVASTPQMLAGKAYGNRLTASDANQIEEVGPGGRLSSVDRGRVELNPWKILKQNVGRYLVKISLSISEDSSNQGHKSVGKNFKKYKKRLVDGIAGLIAISALVLTPFYRRLDQAKKHLLKRVLILPASMISCYLAAIVLFPWLYIPSRYISIGASVVMLCVVPVILWLCLELFKNKTVTSLTFIAAFVSLALLLHGGLPQLPDRINAKRLALAKYEKKNQLEQAVTLLPPTALIAGWPSGRINSIPYVTGRKALITEETHQVFHEDYLYEMRRRMDALIELMCVRDGVGFNRAADYLRTEFEVSHILLDLRYQRRVPQYFAPFGTAVTACRAHNPSIPISFLISFGKQRIIYQDKEIALLEVSAQ